VSANAPGIQQNIYLDGLNLAVPADRLNYRVSRAETVERLLNSYAVIDRPYAFAGAPGVITKFSFEFGFSSIAEADYQAVTEMESHSGFLDLCIWKPITETFSGDGTSVDFTLQRRIAIEEIDGGLLPADAATIYATVATVAGTPTSITLDDVDAATGRQAFHFASAPAAAEDNVRVFYVPLFYVRILDPERDLSTPFSESTTLRAEEA
jgi:hypothetical protein